MEKVIVAFESEKTSHRIKDILEQEYTASCILCRSADQVRRAIHKSHISTVVCGYKFPDGSAEDLFADLPITCSMLMVATNDMLEMCEEKDIFKLAAPVSKRDLIATVQMLLQMSHRLEKFVRPQRKQEEQSLVEEAKAILIRRNGMTEEQAHRYLQKKSMDSGMKMVQMAEVILAKG